MADNVLGTLFQSIADAIRNKTGKAGTIIPANFANEINSIVVGSGGSGGAETGVGDLKIAKGSFYGGDGFRKTINHGLGTMPDLVVVWYSGLDSDVNGELSEKAALSFSCGLRSSMSEVTTYKGYQHYFASIGLDSSKYIDDSSNTVGIYCPDDNTFEVGAPSGSVAGVFADSSYNWLAISGMGGVIGGGSSGETAVVISAKMETNTNITWTLYSDGLLEFTGSGVITNTGTMSAPYYQYKDFVTKIVVGEGITSVGKYGIPNMSCVKSVTLPSTVTTIGTYAFYNYYELEEINLDNITSIDSYAFSGCKLLDVALPANIKSIGGYAFERCALTTFNPPSTLTSIGGFAFYSCDFTGEVTIPATVTSGNPQMFAYCSGITKLNIHNSPTSFGFNCFGDMGKLETNIPSTVTSMGKNCFLRTTPTAVTFDDPNGWIVSTDSAGTAGVVELSSADLSDPVTAASLIVQYGGTHYFIKSA